MSKYLGEKMKNIFEPDNRELQIIGSIAWILDNDYLYEDLKDMQARLEAAAMKCFLAGPRGINGYHDHVIRSVMEELKTTGKIDYDAPPYTVD